MMMNFKKNQNNAVCSMDCKNCPNGASQPNPMDDPMFDKSMQDIYAGDFLVVGLTEDDFGSLTSEQMQKFEEQFHQPQMFVRMGHSIMAIPVPDDMVKKMEEKAAKPQEKGKPAPDRDSL